MVLSSPWTASFPLVIASPLPFSVAVISSQLSTCFSIALSPRAASIGSSLSSFVLPLFPLLLCCVTFFLVLVRTSCLSFPGFLSICSTHSNFWFGLSGMIVVFGPLDLELLPFSPLSKPVCVSTSLGFKRFVSSRRKRYFLRQWGASGVVCSTSCGELVFHL